MITKEKTTQFKASSGVSYLTIEEAKVAELKLLCGGVGGDNETALSALVGKSREAIAILRLGLPRKPRTPKPAKKSAKRAAAVNAAIQDMKQ